MGCILEVALLLVKTCELDENVQFYSTLSIKKSLHSNLCMRSLHNN